MQRLDTAALFQALEQQRTARAMTWAQVAATIGVSASTIRRTRIGGRLEVDGMLAMVGWLGTSVENFVVSVSGQGPTQRNLTSISPFFIVEHLPTSIAYYVERMGFQLDFQGPEDDPYYGRVSRDGIGIMLKAIVPEILPRPNHTRHEWARWDASIYTLDPDTLFHEFKLRGASFVKELSFIDEGLWGFEIADADGYVLAYFRLRDG